MTLALLLQIAVLAFFLYQFWRGSKLIWGVGLLTVGFAILFNVVLGTIGRESFIERLGVWFPIMNGILFGGGAFWLWGLLSSIFNLDFSTGGGVATETAPNRVSRATTGSEDGEEPQPLSKRAVGMRNQASEYDQKLIFDQIYNNLSASDVLDLIFDLEFKENEVLSPTLNMSQTISNIIDRAFEDEKTADLALAVERILTPVPADHFPRLARLSPESPPTILRRYLLTFYSLDALEELAGRLEIDWERLGIESKQQKVRNLLWYVMRRNRLGELIEVMKSQPVPSRL